MAAEIPCCSPKFWFYILVIIGLVVFAGLMAGLTLGLMSLGLLDLQVLIKSGTPEDRKHAAKIFPVVKNQHLLLCTLLIGNSLAMEALPIFLDSLVAPWVAVLLSVTLILMFGEILPQAICTRYGMSVGATLAPVVHVLLFLFFPVAYPISKILDWFLGKGHTALLRRAELKTFVNFHGNEAGKGGDLTHDETTIIAGALELTEKTAKVAMTPISKAFSLNLDGTLDEKTLNVIMTTGHSRIPVYVGNPGNIIGLILAKNLLMVDPKDAIPLRKMTIRKIPRVSENLPLYDILNEFQKGHSHIAVVIRDGGESMRSFWGTKEGNESMRSFKKILEAKPPLERKLDDEKHKATPDPILEEDRVPGASIKKRQKNSDCILDIEHTPIPVFSQNEEVVGVITMEDVIEELLQEEILDETDEYIDIHNRIKVNMQVSQRKDPSSNFQNDSTQQSPVSSYPTAPGPTPTLSVSPGLSVTGSPREDPTQHSPASPYLAAPGPTPTLSLSPGMSVTGSPLEGSEVSIWRRDI